MCEQLRKSDVYLAFYPELVEGPLRTKMNTIPKECGFSVVGNLFFNSVNDMVEYELFYLVGESKDAELARIKADVEKLVTDNDGTFLAPQTEEKRKLAYMVKNESRGTYIARRFTLPDKDERDAEGVTVETHPLVVINRALQLSKDVLRSLIVTADTLPELKAIPREERPKTESRGNRYEKRGAVRPMPAPVVAPKEEVKKVVSEEEMDAQLKAKLDI